MKRVTRQPDLPLAINPQTAQENRMKPHEGSEQ
jgi:hypothetical protein